jgi:uncharacterized protein
MRRRIIFFPVFLLAFFLLLIDWYVFQGVRTLTATLQSELVQTIIHAFYWLISVGIVLSLLYLLYSFLPGRKLTLLFNTIFNSFLALFLSKLIFALVLIAEDIYRLVAAIVSSYTISETAIFPDRSVIISSIAGIFAVIPFFSFMFGITRGKYHYQVHNKTLYFDDLPRNFDGFKVVQISDIHAGSFDNQKAVQRGVDLIKAQNPDLFVFTGDLVNNVAEEIWPWIPVFNQIKAKYGQFSIVGNHDYGDYISWQSKEHKSLNFEKLKHAHRQLGYQLLLDEHVKIEKEGQFITVLGVENWGVGFAQRGNLKKALDGVEYDSFKILLSHDPSHWDAQVKNNPTKIHLTLSGHTHGMQFGIELWNFKWSPVKYRYHNWAGLTEEFGRYLYVNRGFGFLGFSGRIGIWPEITVIELRKREG